MTELDAKRTKLDDSDDASSPIIDDMFAEDDLLLDTQKNNQNVTNRSENIDDSEGYYSTFTTGEFHN